MYKKYVYFLGWFALSLFIGLLDQTTKLWISDAVSVVGTDFILTPWLNITLVHNWGAAFSFLSQESGWQRWFFVVLALSMSLVLMTWMRATSNNDVWKSLSASFLLGGVLGNLLDRLLYGYVIDFISFHYQDFYFPIFNIADIAINIGVFLLVFRCIFFSK